MTTVNLKEVDLIRASIENTTVRRANLSKEKFASREMCQGKYDIRQLK